MPNEAAAVALLEQMFPSTDDGGGEGTVEEAGTPSLEGEGASELAEEPAPDPAAESDAETKRKELEARLDARLAEQREKSVLRRRQAELEERERAVRSEAERWSSVAKNPLALLAADGRDPRQVISEFTRAAAESGTPEGKIREVEERYRRETSELRQRLEAYEAQIRQRDAEAQKAKAESEFIKIVESEDYDLLRDYFTSNEELLQYAHNAANVLARRGESYTLVDVADQLLIDARRREEHREKRRKNSSAVPAKKAPEKAKAGEPRTLSNEMASTQSSTSERRKTLAEREAEAMRLI